jgi:hypothetical protein
MYMYSVHRVPDCLSLRWNWVPPPPSPQASVSPLLDPGGGGEHYMNLAFDDIYGYFRPK